MNCSDCPSAWELWVRNTASNQNWMRYGVYETHKQAMAKMNRIEGIPLELKIVPLYPAIIEDDGK